MKRCTVLLTAVVVLVLASASVVEARGGLFRCRLARGRKTPSSCVSRPVARETAGVPGSRSAGTPQTVSPRSADGGTVDGQQGGTPATISPRSAPEADVIDVDDAKVAPERGEASNT